MTSEELLKENANSKHTIVAYERRIREQAYQLREQQIEIELLACKLAKDIRSTRLGAMHIKTANSAKSNPIFHIASYENCGGEGGIIHLDRCIIGERGLEISLAEDTVNNLREALKI